MPAILLHKVLNTGYWGSAKPYEVLMCVVAVCLCLSFIAGTGGQVVCNDPLVVCLCVYVLCVCMCECVCVWYINTLAHVPATSPKRSSESESLAGYNGCLLFVHNVSFP